MATRKIGRIMSATLRTARVEFVETANIEEGMLIYYILNGDRILARVEKLETHKYTGLTGYIFFLEPLNRPPKAWQEIYIADDMTEDGMLFVGEDRGGQDIRLRLNPLFEHVLVAGMTRAGKTHFLIILLEETIPLGVPSLILDSHGEFVNLVKTFPDKVVVVEEIRIQDLIGYLQQRKTVVYNLLGLHKASKANRIAEIIGELTMRKEQDYAQAENNPLLLEVPPVLIFLDEAELYAPNRQTRMGAIRSEALGIIMNVVKEGGKFGIGLIVATQRVTKLDIDVRGQCNSAAIFRLVDIGSLSAVRMLDYITRNDLKAMNSFERGQCLLAGAIVKRPRIIHTRDIETEKVKKVDFAGMLGIKRRRKKRQKRKVAPKIRVTNGGDVIDVETGEVIESAKDRLVAEDREAYEQAEGDGVILRSPEEQADVEKLGFATHLSPEDQNLLDKLRKPDDQGDRLIG